MKDRNTIITIDSKKMREDERMDYGLKRRTKMGIS